MRVKPIRIPIAAMGLLGYFACLYIAVRTAWNLEKVEFVEYVWVAVLPLFYAVGTTRFNNLRDAFEVSPARYIADVLFFVKMVVIPFVFYAGSCDPGDYNSQVLDYYIPAVLLELSQYVITVYGLRKKWNLENRRYLLPVKFPKKCGKYLLFGMSLIFMALTVMHPEFVTDYFSILDYDRIETEMMKLHGGLYWIWVYLAVTAYSAIPLILCVGFKKKLFGQIAPFTRCLFVLPLSFMASTVNKFQAVLIDIVILTYMYVAFKRHRKKMVIIGALGVIAVIPLVSQKLSGDLLLFFNAYIEGFVNDAAIFMLPAQNRLSGLFSAIFKSIPLVAGFFQFIPNDDSFSYVLFRQAGRNDMFPSMAGQLIYFFGPLYPLLYCFFIKFIKRLEVLATHDENKLHNILGYMMIYHFSLIIYTGNVNSFISYFFQYLIVMLGINTLEIRWKENEGNKNEKIISDIGMRV